MPEGMEIEVKGLTECLRAFNGLEGDLKKQSNAELRSAAMKIAADTIPMLGGSGAPQEAALLASLGAKSDRLVTVRIARKPRLSGLKKTPAATAKGIVFWPVEQGSDYPPFHNPAEGGMIARHKDKIQRIALPRYQAALAAILRKWNLL